MPKPSFTYVLQRGKIKIVKESKDAKEEKNSADGAKKIILADYLFKKCRVKPQDIQSGLKIIQKSIKDRQDRLDGTTIGTAIKMSDHAKDLFGELAKQDNEIKKANSALMGTGTYIAKIPDFKDNTLSPEKLANGLQVLVIVLLLWQRFSKER